MKKLPVITRWYARFLIALFVWVCYLYMYENNPETEGLAHTHFLGWYFDTGILLSLVFFVFVVGMLMAVAAYFIEKRVFPILAVVPAIGIGLAAYWSPYVVQDKNEKFASDSSSASEYPVEGRSMYGPRNQEYKGLMPLLVMVEKSFGNYGEDVLCPVYLHEEWGAVLIRSGYDFDPGSYRDFYDELSEYEDRDRRIQACEESRKEILAKYDWHELNQLELAELRKQHDWYGKYFTTSSWHFYRGFDKP